jgi:response regulator RpfG family c-di-GMP phosphodiesterase
MANENSTTFVTIPRPGYSPRSIEVDEPRWTNSSIWELLDSSIVLKEDWDDLADSARQELTACTDRDSLLALLVEHRLLTQYQAGRIDAGKMHGLILGNYRVLDRLGRGGMGIVYKGEHLRMRRLAAIKVLPLHPDTDENLLRRFLMEMRTIAQMKHPNIIEALDDGHLASDAMGEPSVHFFVMEYVPGYDLDELVTKKGPMQPDQACNIIYQVAGALAEAYQHNVVHRDIKPSNIRVTADQQAKLLDFGLVRRLHHRITDHGTALGTLDYIAPEQACDASNVDIRADIYGLGGSLFWCLTGRTPFEGDGTFAAKMLRRMNQKPPSLRVVNPMLPADLDALIGRMMACNPDDRYPTPQAVMKALLPFLKSGSSDSFYLAPSADKKESHHGQSSAPKSSWSGIEQTTLRVPRVLVADDTRMVRSFCAHSLHEAGIECDQVENGALALSAINAKAYDLLLTDWMMPEMTGLELCQKVRENPPSPNFKIILFSSEVTDDKVAQMLAGGADDFLPKQFSPVQLVARVQAALRHKDLQDRSAILNRHLLACNRQMEENLLSRDSDLVQVRNALVLGLTDMVCRRDAENIQHVLRLQRFCRLLAEEATGVPSLADQIDQNFIAMLECCAPLHDIGKVALPDYILTKAGNFDAEERLIMQTHTVIGAETLQNVAQRHGSAVAFLQMAIDIARHHHERYDGQGYPDRLRGNDIPLAARIVAICDAYDSLRTRQSYKPALGHSATLEIMLENSPGQFDPLLLQAFRRCASEFERVYREMPG